MTAHDLQPPGKYRLRVADYLTLSEAGAFEGLRTQLIDGEIIVMSPQFRPHGMVKLELYDRLREVLRAMGSPLRPVTEFSLDLGPTSMPDPDIMLTSQPDGAGPVPAASVALVIEVADTTLAMDLGAKAALYARHGIPEYWVADVNARVIHQMWVPGAAGYANHREARMGELVASLTLPGLAVETGGP